MMPDCGEADCQRESFWTCDGCGKTLCSGHYRIRVQIPLTTATGAVKPSGALCLCGACRDKPWALRMVPA